MANKAAFSIPAFTVGGRFYLVIAIAFFALVSLAVVGAARASRGRSGRPSSRS
jgi:hypothetical protein